MNSGLGLIRRYGIEILAALAAAAGALEVALRPDSSAAPETPTWFAAPATALIVTPLLLRRRWPVAAPFAVWLLGAALSFIDGRLVVYTGAVFVIGIIAAFLLGQLADARQARAGLLTVIAGAAIIVYNRADSSPGDFVFTPGLFTIAWIAGYALRERSARALAAEERAALAEREREAATRLAIAEERARIARELHDVVAHAVSVMVLQAGAVRHHLPEAQAEDREALTRVEQAGRNALTEMRRLLGAMRQQDDGVELAPHPGIDRLPALLGEVEAAGLPVRLHTEGDAFPLPPALDLSAYRIVQEGLTNALRHARASHADVTLRYAPGELSIEVRDDGLGGATNGLGHGLVGLRERVTIYGGTMTAGADPRGGFVLKTRLPIDPTARGNGR